MKPWQKLAASGAAAAAIAGSLAWHYEVGGAAVNRAYYDAHGKVWTICGGHTKGVKPGDTVTDAQCQRYLQDDLADASTAVQRCITAPLTELQRAAFIDAAFNLGPAVVCGSTLQRLANAGDVMGACLQLTDALDKRGNAKGWVHAGGQELLGLRNRRTDERNLCLGYLR